MKEHLHVWLNGSHVNWRCRHGLVEEMAMYISKRHAMLFPEWPLLQCRQLFTVRLYPS